MAKKADEEPQTITKAEAVRRALADGVDAPLDGVAYLKEKFGLNITGQQFSTYKSIEKKRSGGPTRKRAARGEGARQSRALPVPAAGGRGDVVLAMEAIKTLVDEYGVDQVKRIAEVFRK